MTNQTTLKEKIERNMPRNHGDAEEQNDANITE